MTAEVAAMAHPAALPTGVAARPRVSAESFRNLAARLKRSEAGNSATIPAMVPVAPPSAAPSAAEPPAAIAVPVLQPAPAPAMASMPVQETKPVITQITPFVPEPVAPPAVATPPVSVAEAVWELDPQEAPTLQPVDIHPSIATLPEPLVETQPQWHTEQVLEPVLNPVFEPSLAPVSEPVTELVLEPVFEPALEPVLESVLEPVLEPAIEPAFEAGLQQVDILPLPNAAAALEVAPLPEALPAETPLAPVPELQGSFADNFTYVPEGGKNKLEAAPTETPAAQDEAVLALPEQLSDEDAAAVADRAVQLELENIWRMLLAKPTAEERAQYLREAALHHAADEEWNKPAPEHDLSLIAPAAETPALETVALDVVAPEVRPLQETLPVPEGQDLSELSRSLLDMMAQGNSSGQPHERALAADTLLRLVPRLELKPLVVLAQRLAMMESPPHLLVSRLIRDPRVEVAGPLLEDCSHISDKDLELVVAEGEPAKLRMIARRRHLTRAISDALVRSGDPSVVLTLVRNMEAEISHDGFQSLLVLCENNEDLMAPLATRHDLGAPFAFELFWLAPPQLRRFILSRFLTDSETLTKILKITRATNSDEEADGEPLSQHALLEALERAARGHIDVAAGELAQIMQISQATVTKILGDTQGDAMVVMLKAAGYPRSAVSGLLTRMQAADLPLVTRARDVAELQTMFETLSFNKARILLTYWDWAQAKTGPYAPVH